MGVTRTTLPFEGRFTQVPNAWARDQRLSRRARGLLLEIMSHRIGWHVSTRSLTRDGPEGRDAVRSMLAELVDAGYLVADQQRADGGRFGEIEYRLDDPHRDGISDAVDEDDPQDDGDATVAGFSGRGAVTVAGETVAGLPVAGESDHKEEHLLEDHLAEHQISLLPGPSDAGQGLDEAFEQFYSVYPRKVGRQKARAKFGTAVKEGTPAHVIIDGAKRYARDPNLPKDRTYIPHPATWIYQGRWADEPQVARAASRGQQKQNEALGLLARALEEERNAQVGSHQGSDLRVGRGSAGSQRAIGGRVA